MCVCRSRERVYVTPAQYSTRAGMLEPEPRLPRALLVHSSPPQRKQRIEAVAYMLNLGYFTHTDFQFILKQASRKAHQTQLGSWVPQPCLMHVVPS